MIRAGRPNAGMPSFNSLSDDELNAIVAFLHSQMDKFAELGGGRRSVEPADLATGNAAAGRQYFNAEGKCSSCHSATGNLAGIGTRLQGLNLLRRDALSQRQPRSNPSTSASPRATFLLPSGRNSSGAGHREDDFGCYRARSLGGATDLSEECRKGENRGSAVSPFRPARKIHGCGHAQCLRLPGDVEVEQEIEPPCES